MAVGAGLILSALAVIVGIAYAAQDDRYPDLAYIGDMLALIGVVAALVAIWLGVAVARLIARRQRQTRN